MTTENAEPIRWHDSFARGTQSLSLDCVGAMISYSDERHAVHSMHTNPGVSVPVVVAVVVCEVVTVVVAVVVVGDVVTVVVAVVVVGLVVTVVVGLVVVGVVVGVVVSLVVVGDVVAVVVGVGSPCHVSDVVDEVDVTVVVVTVTDDDVTDDVDDVTVVAVFVTTVNVLVSVTVLDDVAVVIGLVVASDASQTQCCSRSHEDSDVNSEHRTLGLVEGFTVDIMDIVGANVGGTVGAFVSSESTTHSQCCPIAEHSCSLVPPLQSPREGVEENVGTGWLSEVLCTVVFTVVSTGVVGVVAAEQKPN